MKKETSTKTESKMSLIVSDDKKPTVSLKAGMKLEVVSISLLDPQLKKSKITAARLCGGTSTCVALIEL